MFKSFLRRVQKKIKNRVKALLVKNGYAVLPIENFPWVNPEYVFGVIRRHAPAVVLDIGANEGQFSHRLRSYGYTGRIISFEPQAAPYQELARAAVHDPLWECHRFGLGDTFGRLEMHVSGFSPSSSIFPIGDLHVSLMPYTAEVGTQQVDIVRLDDWLATRTDLVGPFFMKVDVQGFETPMLRGAGVALRATSGVFVELNFAELFRGQSKYYEVMRLLDEAGFYLFGLFDLNLDPSSRGYLWGDGLFVRMGIAGWDESVARTPS